MEIRGSNIAPKVYDLELGQIDGRRAIVSMQLNGNHVKNFERPVTLAKTPKIYVVLAANEIVYVGYTGQSITNRLRDGFNPTGANGYHGYQWRFNDRVTLLVWPFSRFEEEINQEDINDNQKHKRYVEAIEAELVYLVRNITGKWPQHQNEIHFNNDQAEEVRAMAESMYHQIKGIFENTK